MKRFLLTAAVAVTGFCLTTPAVLAADAKDKKAEKAKPYPLNTCLVSDEKLGGEMGEPYVFVYQGQEIKLCCKPCQKDFKKDTAKYMKKLADAGKKAK